MARLATFGNTDRDVQTRRIQDIQDTEVVIRDAAIREGNYGEYVVMSIVIEGGEIVPVLSGAMFVVDAIKDVISKKAFPVEAKFTQRGRSWIFE